MPFTVRTVVVLLFVLLPAMSSAALLEGKTTIDSVAVAGVEVLVYPVDVLSFNSPAPYKAGPTGADGQFAIDLPKGQYYLLAKGKSSFAYYGRNPISVTKEGLKSINLLMTPDNLVAPDQVTQMQTGATGVVSVKGQPVAGAVVMVYPDLSSQLKGMGLGLSAPTGEDGVFELPVPAGNYYLVVRVRKNGMMAGPLRAGDLFGYLPGNPISLTENMVAKVHIPVITVPEKVERYASSLFGNTTISGRILDTLGQPVTGLSALLYDDPMMLNRPLYVSKPTGSDGSFVISFPKGGIYYLAARDELGGTPAPGELYGRYQGSADHSLRIRTGKALKGIEIKVEEVY
jgi:hypothetical protein